MTEQRYGLEFSDAFVWTHEFFITEPMVESYYISVSCENDVDESNNYKLIVLDSTCANLDEAIHSYDFFVGYDDKNHVSYCSNDCNEKTFVSHWYKNDYSTECVICGFQRDPELGDVNGDAAITIGDVTALLNFLSGTSVNPIGDPDINQDGVITIGDVTMLLNMLVGIIK